MEYLYEEHMVFCLQDLPREHVRVQITGHMWTEIQSQVGKIEGNVWLRLDHQTWSRVYSQVAEPIFHELTKEFNHD